MVSRKLKTRKFNAYYTKLQKVESLWMSDRELSLFMSVIGHELILLCLLTECGRALKALTRVTFERLLPLQTGLCLKEAH